MTVHAGRSAVFTPGEADKFIAVTLRADPKNFTDYEIRTLEQAQRVATARGFDFVEWRGHVYNATDRHHLFCLSYSLDDMIKRRIRRNAR